MNTIFTVLGFVAVFTVTIGANLLGDEVKGWIGRIPYAILWIAARRVPRSHRISLHAEWKADLAAALDDKDERPISRLLLGARLALGLVTGGRQVAIELGSLRTVPEGSADLTSAAAAVWSFGPPRGDDEFVAFFKRAYGLNLKPSSQSRPRVKGPSRLQYDHWGTTYQGPGEDLIVSSSDGACGSSYWEVLRLPPGQDEPVRLILCHTINETGKVKDLQISPYS